VTGEWVTGNLIQGRISCDQEIGLPLRVLERDISRVKCPDCAVGGAASVMERVIECIGDNFAWRQFLPFLAAGSGQPFQGFL